MGEQTGIAWTDHTFNPWWGCAKVSQGCKHCYAEALSARFYGDRLWGVNGDRKVASETTWAQLRKWDRAAAKADVRRRVFCDSMSDLFERHRNPEINARLDAARARLFSLIEELRNLDFLLLTKRPGNILDMVPPAWRYVCPRNVWLGASVCGDVMDAEIVAHLSAASETLMPTVTFLSYEPAIGPPDFLFEPFRAAWRVDWIIVGGESGPGARPFNFDWAREVIRYAPGAQTYVFVKQMGSNPVRRYGEGTTPVGLRHKAGADPDEWPVDLRVREFPQGGF